MIYLRHGALAMLATVSTLSASVAAENSLSVKKEPPQAEDVRGKLAKKVPGAKAENVRPSPIPGIYEITIGTATAYMTADGKYLISGDLYELASKTNLSEVRRGAIRVQSLASLRDADTVVFAPKSSPKHTVTIFMDVDCGYCRKLHSEIAELNNLGIRVRYAAYPRSGPGTSSWSKMESVWCAKDRRDALTRVQLDEDIGAPKCGATPIASQFKLGEDIGVNGTPAIFTENGDYIGGYLPPQKLLAELDELKTQAAANKKTGS